MARMLQALKRLEANEALRPGGSQPGKVARREAPTHEAALSVRAAPVTDCTRIVARPDAWTHPVHLEEFGERLAREVRQAGARSLLFVGVEESSATEGAALDAAALLAKQGDQRVLLMDGDWKRRALSSRLSVQREPGATELVRGDCGIDKLVLPTAIPGVSLLPAGRRNEVTLAEITPRLAAAFHELAAEFSLVVVDGGRVGDAAATAVARAADATYFVVRLGAVPASTAQEALRDFRAAAVRVAGCVAI